MIDPKHLAYFVSVYQRGSFHAAASAVGVSQSAMTKHIKRFEAQLGLPLFNRTTRKVEPTDIARALITHAESTLQSIQSFSAEAELLRSGELGSLRIGVIALAAEVLVTPALVRLAESHPQLEIDVVVGSEDVYRDLVTGRCDAVIGDEANYAYSDFVAAIRMNPIRREALHIVCRDGHPARFSRADEELGNYPWAIPSRYFSDNALFRNLQTQLPISQHYRLTSLTACLQLAQASNVITIAPESMLSAAGYSNLVPVDTPAGADLSVRFALFSLAANTPTPAIRALMQAFQSPV